MNLIDNYFKNKSVLIMGVANYGRTEVLRDYFINHKIKNLYIIMYDGPYAAKKNSCFLHYKEGELQKKIKYNSFTIKKLSRIKYPLVSIVFFYYFLNTIKSVKFLNREIDYSISVGTFLTACNQLLKRFFLKKIKTIYYSIDYYFNEPNYLGDFLSFQKFMINIFYKVDLYLYNKTDYYWELTESIEKTRKKIVGKKLRVRKKFLVPLGYSKIFHNSMDIKSRKIETQKNNFALIGVISKNQGLDLILDLVQKYYMKTDRPIKFIVMGTGPYLEEYKEKVKKLRLESFFKFTGFLEFDEMANYLSKVKMGITLFPDTKSNHSLSAEPGKIKLFYSLNTPIIISDNVLISKKILEKGAGLVIKYGVDNLYEAITKSLNKKIYDEIVDNANLFKNSECISDIHFDRAFKNMVDVDK